MEQYIYNRRLVDWINKQPNRKDARETIRNILGCTKQTLWHYEKNKRNVSFVVFSLLTTQIKDL